MIQQSPYTLTTLLSAAVVFAMGVCLLALAVPRDEELRSYRISRRLLGMAYLFLALQSIAGVLWNVKIHADMLTPIFQAFMFTYALTTLLNLRYFNRRRVLRQCMIIGAVSLLIVINTYVLPAPNNVLAHVILIAYFGLFTYYVWLFFSEYRNYKRRADNYYAGNERSFLRWVSQLFVMAAVIGAVAGSLTENDLYFWIFIAGYTFVYVYMAIRYINYLTLFHRIAPVVGQSRNDTSGGNGISEELIRQAVGGWIENKKFLDPDVSLGSLAQELKSNPTYLSRYINTEYGQNFRSWINSLRIAEAQRLITADGSLSLAEVGQKAGIPSISTFYRQFASVTGMAPTEYRKKFGGGSKAE